MLTTPANPSTYDLQRTSSTVPTLGLSVSFAHLSVGGMLSTTLFLFPTSYSTLLLALLQTEAVTNFIQLVSPQPVDRFSQTKLHWKAPNESYPHIYGRYKSGNK